LRLPMLNFRVSQDQGESPNMPGWNGLFPVLMAALFGMVSSGQVAQAAPIDFTSTNPNLVIGPNSISQTVNGDTIAVQAFTTEVQGSAGTIYGPFPTSAAGEVAGLEVFGTKTDGVNNPGLGLNSQPLPGINVTGTDFGGGNFAPGFDNVQFAIPGSGRTPNPSFEFALFSFSSPTDVSSVSVVHTSNFGESFWVAYGSTAPNPTQDFLSAFSGYTFANEIPSNPGPPFTAALSGANGISYLAVGALPQSAFGPLASFGGEGDRFYIDGLDAVVTATVPAPLIGFGLPAFLAVGGAWLGAMLLRGAMIRRSSAVAR
jgi:hypothetical protein